MSYRSTSSSSSRSRSSQPQRFEPPPSSTQTQASFSSSTSSPSPIPTQMSTSTPPQSITPPPTVPLQATLPSTNTTRITPVHPFTQRKSKYHLLPLPPSPTPKISAIQWSVDGEYLVTAGEDCTLTIWSVKSIDEGQGNGGGGGGIESEIVALCKGHTETVEDCIFDPLNYFKSDGSSSNNKKTKLNDSENNASSSSSSSKSFILLSISKDATLKIWSVTPPSPPASTTTNSNKQHINQQSKVSCLQTITLPSHPLNLVHHPTLPVLVIGTIDNLLLHLSTISLSHSKQNINVSQSNSNSNSTDVNISVNPKAEMCYTLLNSTPFPFILNTLRFSPNGSHLLAGACENDTLSNAGNGNGNAAAGVTENKIGVLKIWKCELGTLQNADKFESNFRSNSNFNILKTLPTSLIQSASLPCHTSSIYGVELSTSKQLLATSSSDTLITLFSCKDKDLLPLRTIDRHNCLIRSIGFNYNSTLVASGSWEGTSISSKAPSVPALSRGGGGGGGYHKEKDKETQLFDSQGGTGQITEPALYIDMVSSILENNQYYDKPSAFTKPPTDKDKDSTSSSNTFFKVDLSPPNQSQLLTQESSGFYTCSGNKDKDAFNTGFLGVEILKFHPFKNILAYSTEPLSGVGGKSGMGCVRIVMA